MIITYLFILFSIIQLFYWLGLFHRIGNTPLIEGNTVKPKVSVVVVFKNEVKNLRILVPKLLDQNYQNYEIVLCDDFSSDSSSKYLASLTDQKVRPLKARQNHIGKKQALTEAIDYAKGEIILVCDADCYPATSSWITSMINQLGDKEIVLGYSPHVRKAGWLNRFIRYETFLTALQYFSYAIAKIPYMGVGRNLLYNRKLFLDSDALKKSSHLASGDDDLFINAVATGQNTTISLDPKSFVYTYPHESLSAFVRQKQRHMSTSSRYQMKHQILLALFALSHVMFFVTACLGLFTHWVHFVIIIWLVVTLTKWFVAINAFNVLAIKDLILVFPLLDFLMFIYYIYLTPSTFLKTKRW